MHQRFKCCHNFVTLSSRMNEGRNDQMDRTQANWALLLLNSLLTVCEEDVDLVQHL